MNPLPVDEYLEFLNSLGLLYCSPTVDSQDLKRVLILLSFLSPPTTLQGRKRQEGDIEVLFTIGNSSMTCGPTDTVCNGPLNPSADYGVRYTLFSGDQLQEFPFFPGAQFTTG